MCGKPSSFATGWTRRPKISSCRMGLVLQVFGNTQCLLRLHPQLEVKQALNVSLCQTKGPICSIVLRLMQLATIGGSHYPQHSSFNIQVLPFECQFGRTELTATNHTAVLIGSRRRSINRLNSAKSETLFVRRSAPGGRSVSLAGFDDMYRYFIAATKMELNPYFRFLIVGTDFPSTVFALKNSSTDSIEICDNCTSPNLGR